MAKYSEEFKVAIVREYLDGRIGYSLLAKKHGVKSKEQIKEWVLIYQKYGLEGLVKKKNNEDYPVQFKLDVLSFMKRTGASRSETALQFGLKITTTNGSNRNWLA